MKNLQNALAIFLLLFALSCRDSGRKTSGPDAADRLGKADARLRSQLSVSKDSLDGNWQRMAESDERKMASTRRLLDEISYTPRYNAIRQRQLLQLHDRVKSLRYDRQSMASSDRIDAYDAAQDSLINGVINLAADTPEAEKFPLISELTNDIQAEHNKTIIYRIKHDTFAREINSLLSRNSGKVQNLGAPYSDMQKVPLFTLSGH